MSERARTGDYQVFFFDEYGGKVKTGRKVKSECLLMAIKKGRRYASVSGHSSFRVDRVIYNSLDRSNRYS
jgi:hypothetical protein